MIKPLQNNVIIDVHKIQNEGGMVFINKSEEKIEKATVVSVGPDVQSVQPGDIIFFKAYALDTIEDMSLIQENDIKAVEV